MKKMTMGTLERQIDLLEAPTQQEKKERFGEFLGWFHEHYRNGHRIKDVGRNGR